MTWAALCTAIVGLAAASDPLAVPSTLLDAGRVSVIDVEGFDPAESLVEPPELRDDQRRVVAAAGAHIASIARTFPEHLFLVRLIGSSDGSRWTSGVAGQIGSQVLLGDIAHQAVARQRCRSVSAVLEGEVERVRIELAVDHDVFRSSGPELRRVRIELWAHRLPGGMTEAAPTSSQIQQEREAPRSETPSPGSQEPPAYSSASPPLRIVVGALIAGGASSEGMRGNLDLTLSITGERAYACAGAGLAAVGPDTAYGLHALARIGVVLLPREQMSVFAEPSYSSVGASPLEALHPRRIVSAGLGVRWPVSWPGGQAALSAVAGAEWVVRDVAEAIGARIVESNLVETKPFARIAVEVGLE